MNIDDIRKSIRELGASGGIRVELATIETVEFEKAVCVCKLLRNSLIINDVQLLANTLDNSQYILGVPKVGTDVLILEVLKGFWVVLLVFEIDSVKISIEKTSVIIDNEGVKIDANKVVFNGGEQSGLVLHEPLVKILNSFYLFLKAIKTVLDVGTITTSAPGSPDVFHAAMKLALQAVKLEEVAGLENQKIKQ